MTTRVVHINDNIPGAVYIGRAVPRRGIKASKWANPFRVENYGRKAAIALYREAITEAGVRNYLLADLPELRNAPALACWCRHDGEARTDDNACHGDVLVDLLETYTDDELRAMGGEG